MDDWKCVYTTDQMHNAQVVKDFLADGDVESVILNKKDSAYTVFGEIEVYVQPEDENMAIELINDYPFE